MTSQKDPHPSILGFTIAGSALRPVKVNPPPGARTKVVRKTVLVTHNGTGTSSVRTVFVPVAKPGAKLPIPATTSSSSTPSVQIPTGKPSAKYCIAKKTLSKLIKTAKADFEVDLPRSQPYYYTQKVAPRVTSAYQHSEVSTVLVNDPLAEDGTVPTRVSLNPSGSTPQTQIKEEVDPLADDGVPIIEPPKMRLTGSPPAKSTTFDEMVAFASGDTRTIVGGKSNDSTTPEEKCQYKAVSVQDPLASDRTTMRTVYVPLPRPQPITLVPLKRQPSRVDPLLGDMSKKIVAISAEDAKNINPLAEPEGVAVKIEHESDHPQSPTESNKTIPQTDNSTIHEQNEEQPNSELKGPISLSAVKGSLDISSKMVAYNVAKYFEERKSRYNLVFNVHQTVADATGLSVAIIRRIMSEADDYRRMSQNFPNSILQRSKPLKWVMSNIVIDRAIRKIILESYAGRRKPPSMKDIAGRCKRDGMAIGSAYFVKHRLELLGFYYMRCRKQKLLVERPEITSWRQRYLRDKERFANENRPVVFVFEVSLLYKRRKRGGTWVSMEEGHNCGERLPMMTILHAAVSDNSFVDGALQFVQSTSYTDNDHCVKWFKSSLLPNVPPGSAIVMGHANHHKTKDAVDRPNMSWTSKDIVHWLKQHTVAQLDGTASKSVLLEKAQNVDVEKKFVIDGLINDHGHVAAHIPPNHRELNPLEFIWSEIKEKMTNRCTKDILDEFVRKEFSTCSEQKLKRAFTTVKKQEAAFRAVDAKVEREVEKIIKQFGGIKPEVDFDEPESSSESDPGDQEGQTENDQRLLMTGEDLNDPVQEVDEPPPGPAKKRRKRR